MPRIHINISSQNSCFEFRTSLIHSWLLLSILIHSLVAVHSLAVKLNCELITRNANWIRMLIVIATSLVSCHVTTRRAACHCDSSLDADMTTNRVYDMILSWWWIAEAQNSPGWFTLGCCDSIHHNYYYYTDSNKLASICELDTTTNKSIYYSITMWGCQWQLANLAAETICIRADQQVD